MKKFYTVFLLFLFIILKPLFADVHPNNAAWPTYNLILKNDVQVSPKIYEFEIWLKATSSAPALELDYFQCGIVVNPAIYNGGTITCTIINTGSGLPVDMQPSTVLFTQVSNVIKLAGKNVSTTFPMTNGQSVYLTKLRLTNTADFAQANPNLTWNFTNTPYPTKVGAVGVTGGNITLPITNSTVLSWHSTQLNPCLNCVFQPIYITGGGSYCSGTTPTNISVGLSSSEIGYNYQLKKNGINEGLPIAGTGTALSWSNLTAGIYTVGTVSPVVNMTGSATITEIITPPPTVNVLDSCAFSLLTASNYTGSLHWSTNDTTPSIIVNSSGNYTVTQTINSCISAPALVVASPISILATPSIALIDTCGYSVLIASNYTGSLLWSTNDTTSTINVNNLGIYTVTQIINSCISNADTVFASPKVIPVTPNIVVTDNCNATSTILITNAVNGANYSWSGGLNGNPATTTSSGIFSVSQTYDGCTSLSATATTNPKSTPLTPIVTVVNQCGNSVLSTTSTGILLWSNGSNTSSINVNTSGTYTVTATENGCNSNSGYGEATPLQVPLPPIVTVINNCNNSVLTAENYTGSLHWSTGDTSQQIVVNTSGVFTVNQTVNTCTSPDATATAINNQPKYFCELRNDEQTSANTYEFDIYLLNDNPCIPLEYASGAYGITINPAIRNGGNITAAIVSGSSEFNSNQAPTGITFTSNQNCIKIAARTAPAAGSGTVIPTTSEGKKVCRVRITNSVPFAFDKPNLAWSFTATPYQSKVNVYLNSVNTLLTADTNSHTTHHLNNLSFTELVAPTSVSVNRNNFCKNDTSTIVLTAFGGSGNYLRWYKDSCNGSFVGSGNPLNITAPDSTTTYFVRWEMANSFTTCASITVNSTLTPNAPIVSVNNLCGLSILQASNYTGNLYWSTAETTTSIQVTNSAQFTVNQTKNGCVSPNTTVTANPKPIPPSLITNYQMNNLCGYSTIQITGNIGSLHWSTNDTTNLLTVSNSGIYSVTQTVNGCSSLFTDIYAEPKIIPNKPTVIVNNFCGTSQLTATNYTGSLFWSNGTTNNPVTVETGTYTVYQVVNGCLSDTSKVTAIPKPIPSIPQITVLDSCGFSRLTASNYSGSLLWSTNETSANINTTNTNSFSLKQIVNGCESALANANANPKTIPTAPLASVINLCDSSTLTASNYSGSLLWSTGQTSAIIMVYNAGLYQVRQSSNGCISQATELNAQPVPSVITAVSISEDINHLCQGSSVTLTANPQNGGNTPAYFWYKNNQLVAGQSNASYTYTANITDNVYCRMTTSLNGCVSSQQVNSNTLSIIVDNPPKYSHIKLYLEGFYQTTNHQMTPVMNENGVQFAETTTDSITLQLAEPYFPYIITYTFGAMLQTNGRVAFDVPCFIYGNYFLVIKHRNHIETWSAIPLQFGGDTITYDFTDAASKASGDNQKQMETNKYAIFAADVNQDGLVDGSDMSEVETANNSFVTGYMYLDINGDGLVDGSDMSVTETNNNAFVYVVQPYTTTANLTTTTATNVTTITAILGGNITYDGGAIVTQRGICYSTSPNPTINNSKVLIGSGMGSFTTNLTGLTSNTTYYVRAYATNSAGTAYGNEVSFTTSPYIYSVYDIDGNGYDTVKIGSQVWLKSNLKTTKFRNGNVIPNVTNATTWSGLTSGAYCNYNNDTNLANTYGRLYNWYVVNTGNLCPTGWHVPTDAEWTSLTTYLGGESLAGGKLKEAGLTHWNSPNTGATNETNFTAFSGGSRSNNSIYENIGNRGYWWASTEYSTLISWNIMLYSNNSNANKDYYYKQNGMSVRCIKGDMAIVSTNTITGISQTTAISGGNITNDGGMTITARGICWSTSPNPTTTLTTKTNDGAGIGNFTSNITGLTAGTTYYVRAYATNSVGTTYGNDVSFTTSPYIYPVYDIDGNGYDTVQIGTQLWMKENLKTTKYRNGNVIPNVTNATTWSGLTSGAYQSCLNFNEIVYLYNGFVVTDNRNICPTGWHVPTDNEWTTVTNFLGGENTAAIKLKDTLPPWSQGNSLYPVSNSSGFSAHPSGYVVDDGNGGCDISNAYWWSSSLFSNGDLWCRWMIDNGNFVTRNKLNKKYGLSIRCLKGDKPILSTLNPTSITNTSSICGGNISSDEGLQITARGVCWSNSPNPSIALTTKTTEGTGTGYFTSNITGLIAGTTYYVRSYATNSFGTAYGNEVSFITTPVIGQSFQGGIVAYILQPNDIGYDINVPHGFIAAPFDQSYGGFCSNEVYGADETAIGYGNQNTIDIVNACPNGSAALICFDLILNNYNDWYLPSKDELNQLYINRNAIGGFTNYYYNSSSESSVSYPWRQNFSNGYQHNGTAAGNYSVRAIRSF